MAGNGPTEAGGRRRGDAARDLAEVDVMPQHDLRGVLAIRPYRQLWIAFGLSSLGDWLGLLAITSLAAQLAGAEGNTRAANYAIGGVLLLRLLPALVLGPIAGAFADRFNRRLTMVIGDVARGALFVSIPIVHTLLWLMIATVLIECASLFWLPAKESTIPNLVPRERLEAANQMNLLGTYGSAPIGALLFTALTLLSGVLGNFSHFFTANPVSFAIYINALTYFVSATVVARVKGIPPRAKRGEHQPSVFRSLIEGWKFVARNQLIRGLVVGIVGAFAAGGLVIGLARTYVESLGAGNPGYGLLVGGVFTGLAIGMLVGPRALVGFSRRRLFGISITGVGLMLVLTSLVQNLVIVAMFTLVLGGFAGIAWVTGYTLIGLTVQDEVRGRTFSFVQNAVQITLISVLAAGPFIAGSLGTHMIKLTNDATATYSGASLTMLLAGLLAALVGLVSYRSMDDRRGISLLSDLAQALRMGAHEPAGGGRFIVFEGGEGAGKSTHSLLLAQWLRDRGYEVVLTHEPGATAVGRSLRELLLNPETVGLSARAEALLYAADRAQHVDAVVRPALERGDIVISDRYMDSSVAYQAAGRALQTAEVARLSVWATRGLRPDLTVLLDIAPAVGLKRFDEPADRLESEPLDFHERVREGFKEQAMRRPGHYLVLDARGNLDELQAQIRDRLAHLLPPPRGTGRDGDSGADADRAPVAAVAPRHAGDAPSPSATAP